MDELPAVEIVHGERGRVGGDLREMLLLALDLCAGPQLASTLRERGEQRPPERPLRTRPVRDLVHERLAPLAEQVRGGPDALLAALAPDEDGDEVGVERQLDRRGRLA